jgi:acetylglutamate kinase
VTTPEVLAVVRDVLVGQIQQSLVTLIASSGGQAVGIAGDEGVLTAERQALFVEGQETDIGLVGDVTGVNAAQLRALLSQGQIPVISTVARGADGTTYNVNADTAAASIAVALAADEFIVLTDVPGLYRNWPDTSELIASITDTELVQMLPRLEEGMVPKMTACILAVRGGLSRATVVDGRQPHCLLVQLAGKHQVGTVVLPADPR